MRSERVKVAYIMSRFPKISETFVLLEILAVERAGAEVEVYPLVRERTDTMHPEAVRIVERAHFEPLLSWAILRSHAHFLSTRPGAYLGALGALIRHNLGSFRYLTRALALFPKTVHFARRMAEDGVTHVHAHFASHPAAAAFVIRRLVDIPYSFTAHGSDLHRDRHMLREKVEEAAFVVPISRFNRDIVLAECGEGVAEKVAVIHCGVDPDFFHPPADGARRAPRGNAGSALRMLCTGTLHEVKGQTHLIEACRLLRERGVAFHCVLVGDGPDRPRLEQQARDAGLGDRIEFRGICQREEVAGLLRASDVLVVPSVPSRDGRREGIPVALLEGAASGLPVVASELSGIPEAVEDGSEGYLITPGDARGIADALGTLALDPALRQRLGAAARERILRDFDLDASARALVLRFCGEGAR